MADAPTDGARAAPQLGPGPDWLPVRATSITSKIVGQVRAALFSGALKPGDALGSEMELARRFGVSRLTVRDALRTLEATGIVEIRVGAGGGARIAEGNPDRFADALAIQLKLVGITAQETIEAQLAIESAAAELAAEFAGDDDLARIEALIARCAASLDDKDAFNEASLGVHFAVVAAAHNRALEAQFKALHDAIWGTYAPQTTPEIAARVLDSHRRLHAALAARDGAAAREAVVRHLQGVRDRAFGGKRRR